MQSNSEFHDYFWPYTAYISVSQLPYFTSLSLFEALNWVYHSYKLDECVTGYAYLTGNISILVVVATKPTQQDENPLNISTRLSMSSVSIHDWIIFHTVAFSLRCGKLTYLTEKVILKNHLTHIFHKNALFVMLSMLTF